MTNVVLVGRSSSHFTRIARLFAHELGVEHEFSPVYDIAALDTKTFADNPTLRVPSLRTEDGTWFGSLGISRELERRATRPCSIVWPEDLTDRVATNAQEIEPLEPARGAGYSPAGAGAADLADLLSSFEATSG